MTNRITKMTSGIVAAIGTYRAVLLCMACAWGLHAGWIRALCAGDALEMWLARFAISWLLLTATFWPTARSGEDKVYMSLFMAGVSLLICGLWVGVAALVDVVR